MRSALRKICRELHLECEAGDPVTELIVTKIVDLAKAGELDSDRLCSRMLAELGKDAPTGRAS
jgi:hypothetical protein